MFLTACSSDSSTSESDAYSKASIGTSSKSNSSSESSISLLNAEKLGDVTFQIISLLHRLFRIRVVVKTSSTEFVNFLVINL
jgi:hypothetical protein